MLGGYRLIILLVSFKRITARLQHHPIAQSTPTLSPDQRDAALMIGQLVATAARFTPWKSRCLVQALVAQRLLAKHRIPGQLYLGVQRDVGPGEDAPGFAAHAWVECGGVVVNGAAEHERFTVVSSYSWGGTDDATTPVTDPDGKCSRV